MDSPGYTWFEERFPDAMQGTVVFVSRTDSNIYPVFIDYIVGPVTPVIQRLNDASPYPLKLVAAGYSNIWEFTKWNATLRERSLQRQGRWFVRNDFIENAIDTLCANGFDWEPPLVIPSADPRFDDDYEQLMEPA